MEQIKLNANRARTMDDVRILNIFMASDEAKEGASGDYVVSACVLVSFVTGAFVLSATCRLGDTFGKGVYATSNLVDSTIVLACVLRDGRVILCSAALKLASALTVVD